MLIADDEPIARQVLREHIESIPGLEVAGEAATGAETLPAHSAICNRIWCCWICRCRSWMAWRTVRSLRGEQHAGGDFRHGV